MKHLRRFNESVTHSEVENLFVDFIDDGGSVYFENDQPGIKNDLNFTDIFSIIDEDFADLRYITYIDPIISGIFKAKTIDLNNINSNLTKDSILFANDYLLNYGLKFKFICMFKGGNIQYTTNLDKIDLSSDKITIVYKV